MKLHRLLQKCSFFLIKLVVFLARGDAHMKLHGLLQKCSFFFRFDWTLADRGGAYMKHSWNSQQTERRTSNVQHPTSNIDDAALNLFEDKRTAACDELSQVEYWSAARNEYSPTRSGPAFDNLRLNIACPRQSIRISKGRFVLLRPYFK
jgi:hypothetical protein